MAGGRHRLDEEDMETPPAAGKPEETNPDNTIIIRTARAISGDDIIGRLLLQTNCFSGGGRSSGYDHQLAEEQRLAAASIILYDDDEAAGGAVESTMHHHLPPTDDIIII